MSTLKYPVKSQELVDLIDEIESKLVSDPMAVRDLSRKLIILGTKENCWYSRAYGAICISQYYMNIGDTDTALPHLQDALEINTRQHYNNLLIRNYNLLGNVYTDYMDHLSAIDAYINALEIAININDYSRQTSIYNNIGNIFFELQNYEKAMYYFMLAATNTEKITQETSSNEIFRAGIIYANLTTVNLKLGNLDQAKHYLDISNNSIYTENSFLSTLVHSNEASYYDAIGDTDRMFAILDDILSYSSFYEQQDNLFEPIVDCISLLFEHREAERLSKFLAILKNINRSINNYYRLHQYQVLYIRYLEEYSKNEEEMLEAYRELYRLNSILNEKERINTSKSLEVKIELFNEKHEKAQLLETSKELQKISQFDELTGIMNRRGYNSKFVQFMEEAAEKKSTIGLILLDIDCFKEYNDTYGHIEGDSILRTIGKYLKKYSNENIVPCRFGGDEFTILCRHCSDEEIEDYIQAVMNFLEKANLEHAHSKVDVKRVTLSCGFVNAAISDCVNTTWLLGAADTALYYSKEHGRNQYCNYANIQ